MAFIAELLLVAVALHAAVLKAHVPPLSVRVALVSAVVVANDRIPPLVQDLHVFPAHELLGLDALLLAVQFLVLHDSRRVDLRLGLLVRLAEVAVEREERKGQEHQDTEEHRSFVVDLHQALSSFASIPGRGSPRRLVVLSFSPFMTRAFATSSWRPQTPTLGTQYSMRALRDARSMAQTLASMLT